MRFWQYLLASIVLAIVTLYVSINLVPLFMVLIALPFSGDPSGVGMVALVAAPVIQAIMTLVVFAIACWFMARWKTTPKT